jgi:hypothetical protein
MKSSYYKLIIMSILIFTFLFNIGVSFAFWASSVQGSVGNGSASVTVGSWGVVPPGYIGVSQNGENDYITLSEIGTTGYPLSGSYIMVSDINLNNVPFTPIGGASGVFSGIFLGNGYLISNVTITTSQTYVGLFARNSGTIAEVSIQALAINVSSVLDQFAGGLSGENTGSITKSYVNGSLTVSSNIQSSLNVATHYIYAGGLVGTNSGFIVDSHSNVNVSSSITVNVQGGNKTSNAFAYAGGLVGINNVVDGITNTYANGSVSASATATANGNSRGNATVYSGGLVGHSTVNGGVKYSFATGNVTYVTAGKSTNTRYVGGLNGLGNALTSYRLTTQSVTGATNTIGTTTTEFNLKDQIFITNNLLWSTSIWVFDGTNYPRLSGNSYI